MMKQISIPIRFFDSTYDSSRYPGSSKCDGIENGANCQYFAYELLRYYGYIVPNLRSSDLWEDDTYTERVDSFEPLDILFFNKDPESYGAHVGIYIGANKVIHLSKEVGYPTVWDMKEFKLREQYSCLLGGKRFKESK